jgi:hypothetical protein
MSRSAIIPVRCYAVLFRIEVVAAFQLEGITVFPVEPGVLTRCKALDAEIVSAQAGVTATRKMVKTPANGETFTTLIEAVPLAVYRTNAPRLQFRARVRTEMLLCTKVEIAEVRLWDIGEHFDASVEAVSTQRPTQRCFSSNL